MYVYTKASFSLGETIPVYVQYKIDKTFSYLKTDILYRIPYEDMVIKGRDGFFQLMLKSF